MGLLGISAICPSSVVCVTGLDGRVGFQEWRSCLASMVAEHLL